MTKNSTLVFNGYLKLSDAEKTEVVKEISEYHKKDSTLQKSLKDDLEKQARVVMGPISGGGCPCCGR